MSYAQITIAGRLGRDPEVRMTQTGKQIVTGSVAVGSNDKTQWFKIVGWEKTGEFFKEAKKGDFVFAVGTLQLGTYEKKTGGAAIDAVVNAQVIRTSHKRDDVGDFGTQQPRQSQMSDLNFDDDIPF